MSLPIGPSRTWWGGQENYVKLSIYFMTKVVLYKNISIILIPVCIEWINICLYGLIECMQKISGKGKTLNFLI